MKKYIVQLTVMSPNQSQLPQNRLEKFMPTYNYAGITGNYAGIVGNYNGWKHE